MTGYIAGTLTTLSAIPQIYRIIQRRSTKDISFLACLCLLFGTFLWAIHGVFSGDYAIIIFNVFSFILWSIITTFKILELTE